MKASPGKYNGIAPRDLEENIKYRLALLRWVTAIGEDDDVHEARRELVWQMCKEDPFFYFDTFVTTYNPRLASPSVPFILYDYQREAMAEMIDCLGREDFLIEKSRDMGASWLCCGIFEWVWHFSPAKTSFLLVSRKEELVDKKGDMKSLMARLDFSLERQPKWLLPRYTRTSLNFINHDNGSAINGESTTGDVARGDRRTAILLDEFAAVDSDYQALRSTRDATNCRIFNATPNGAKGAFYDMRCKPEVRKFRFHWSLHPDKALGLYVDDTGKQRSPWYDGECARCVHHTEIAQELDIDYNASESQFFEDADLDRLIQYTRDPVFEGVPIYDPDIATLRGFEPKVNGELKFWQAFNFNDKPAGRGYSFGIDISQGTGATPSVCSIGDMMTGERVAEVCTAFRKPEDFAVLCVSLAKWFNDAFVVWEINGPGTVFTDKIIELGYRNVYYRKRLGGFVKRQSQAVGWASNKESKLKLLAQYRKSLTDRHIKTYSKASLDECRSYTFSPGGEVQHARIRSASNQDGASARENHGDRVIADALLAFALEERTAGRLHSAEIPLADAPPSSMAYRRYQAEQQRKAVSTW